MTELRITADHSKEVLAELDLKIKKALEECGLIAEGYAKGLCPVDTGALRNSISHKVVDEAKETACYIGTNQEYAPYVEFGTGQYYSGGRRTPWVFKDSKGNWHRTTGQKAQPYIRPSVSDHTDEYRNIIQTELKG